MSQKWKTIKVTSGYGYNTKQPFVEINDERLTKPMQLSPEEARDLALNLLESAEAAEQDAFLVEWVKQNIASDETEERSDKMAAGFLYEFRKWREKYGMGK